MQVITFEYVSNLYSDVSLKGNIFEEGIVLNCSAGIDDAGVYFIKNPYRYRSGKWKEFYKLVTIYYDMEDNLPDLPFLLKDKDELSVNKDDYLFNVRRFYL